MKTPTLLAAAALALALPATPLAARDMVITLQFTPKENVTANLPSLDGADPGRPIQVLPLKDSRPLGDPRIVGENRERKTPRVVRASGSVADFATAVLTTCFSQWGIRLGSGGLILRGELTNLFVTEENTYSTQATIRFSLEEPDGKKLWEGIANGDARQWGASYKGENYNEQLSDALKGAYANLASNPGFQKAWTGRTASAAPAPAKTVTPEELKKSILSMMEKGIATNIIAGYARGVRVDPALTPDDIVAWKAAGIPDEVLEAAVSR